MADRQSKVEPFIAMLKDFANNFSLCHLSLDKANPDQIHDRHDLNNPNSHQPSETSTLQNKQVTN